MLQELLAQAGLTASQSKVYLTLIEKGQLSPPEVATLTGESRTNAYMVLERLESLDLIEKVPGQKRVAYQAKNPVALEKLIESQRTEILQVESRIRQSMPQLLSYYYSFTEKPGVRFYEGAEGMKSVYQDILRTKQTLYLVRSRKKEMEKVLGAEYVSKFIAQRVKLGISVVALTPDSPESNRDPAQDAAWLMARTWLPLDDYDEPVEINIYGSKVAFISFGEELFATVIESPQIAQALRKIILLVAKLTQAQSAPRSRI